MRRSKWNWTDIKVKILPLVKNFRTFHLMDLIKCFLLWRSSNYFLLLLFRFNICDVAVVWSIFNHNWQLIHDRALVIRYSHRLIVVTNWVNNRVCLLGHLGFVRHWCYVRFSLFQNFKSWLCCTKNGYVLNGIIWTWFLFPIKVSVFFKYVYARSRLDGF